MKAPQRKKLEDAGWKIGSADEFLELSPEESILIDIKLSLAPQLKELRTKRHMTQADLAKLIGSSQSRVAKMEAAEQSISVDLYIRSFASLGASQKDIGGIIGGRSGQTKRAKAGKTKVSAK